jgi:uncharacterized protein (DUF2267 family)
MTGIQALDTAVETAEEWISALMARLGWQDRQKVYLAFLAALHALRDSLPRDEAGYLGVQLPVLLRGLYFEGWHPASHIPRAKTRSGLLERIQEGVHRDPGIDAEQRMPSFHFSPSACQWERSMMRKPPHPKRCGCFGRAERAQGVACAFPKPSGS